MSTTTLLSFTVVALLTVVTPGPDTLLVVRTTLMGGRRSGIAAVVGVTIGCLVWAIAGLVGLAALLTVSEVAYDVVRIAGAAYLVWLGASALWRSRMRARPLEDHGFQAGNDGWASFRAGLVWLPILVWLATRARQLLLRERVRLWLDRVTATVLVGLGVKVALDARP